MSFTYTTGIPAAGNNPSNDQPNMLQNTNAISSLINVDHIGFNNADGGQHAKITFNNVAAPSSPTNPLSYLFTAANNAEFSWPTFLNAEGSYNVLPDPGAASTGSGTHGTYTSYGIQWGKIILNYGIINITSSASNSTATYKVPFNNFIAGYASLNTSSGGTSARYIGTVSSSGTTITVALNGAVNTATMYYLAIGN